MRTSLLLFAALLTLGAPPTISAADPAAPVGAQAPPVLATWTLGDGSIANSSAKPGSDVALGQIVTSSSAQPAKITLTAPLAGSLTLSPGAVLALSEEIVADQRELVIDLTAGAVQVDLRAKGDYAGVRVRGAALDVRVTGTLFVVQRVKRDADYLALVQGKLSAGLRKEIAEALGQGQRFELDSRQGIGATATGGLEAIATLVNRPQIASLKESIEDQGTGVQQGDGGWETDLAFDLLSDLIDQLGLDDAVLGELVDALGEALFDDLNAGPGDQVITNQFGTAPSTVLRPPPPPPQ